MSKMGESAVKWKVIILEVSFPSNTNGIIEELADHRGVDAGTIRETPDMQPEVSDMPQKKWETSQ